jgi:hypothetical protein
MIQVLMPVVQACTTLSSNPSTAKNNNKKIYLIYHNARNANAHTHIILYYIILYYIILYYIILYYIMLYYIMLRSATPLMELTR